MAVTVGRGVLSTIRRSPEEFALVVEAAADPEAAARGLQRACADIRALDAGWDSAWGLSPGDMNNPKWVSGVMHTGLGPMVIVDGGDVPYRLLRRVPAIVARHLEEAGVTDAVVAVPKPARHWSADLVRRSAALYLYPPPPPERASGWAPIAPACVDRAAAWLAGGPGGGGGRGRPGRGDGVPRAAARGGLLSRAVPDQRHRDLRPHRQHQPIEGGRGRLHEQPSPPGAPRRGQAATDAELVEDMHRLEEVGRALAADVAQAFVAVGYAPKLVYGLVKSLCDEVAFDAFGWQVLGPGHLARLGAPPPGARPLPGGRVEVAVGDTAHWIPASGNLRPSPWRLPPTPELAAVRDHARRQLAPLLLPDDELRRIWAMRHRLGEYADGGEGPSG